MTPLALVNCYIGSTFRSMEEVWSDSSSHTTGYFVFVGQVSNISLNKFFLIFPVFLKDIKMKLLIDIKKGCA